MVQVKNDATGEIFDAPDDQLGLLASKGGFSFPAGTAVPIRHSDGVIESIPVEQFWAQPGILKAATPEELAAHSLEQQRAADEAKDAALQEQYGSGLLNIGRAGAEAAARGATLGISDYLLTRAGVESEGLRERAERNPIVSTMGEVAGAIVPAVLTGGESVVAQAGLKGAARAAAAATPTALAETVGARVGAKVASELGEGFAARLATGSARMAAEGALSGVGGEISSRALNGQDLLDSGTMDEYLMAAGGGALIGGAFGGAAGLAGAGLGAAGRAAKSAYGKVRGSLDDALGGAQKAGQDLSATIGSDIPDVAAAEARIANIPDDELEGLIPLREKARAKLESAAPEGQVLTSAAGERADAPLRAIGDRVKAEARELGVSDDVAESSWKRIENGKREFDNLDRTHDDTVKALAAKGDELEKLRADVLDDMDLSRRNESLREALAVDRTASAPDQFYGAMKAQHDKIRAALAEFAEDPDPQLKSTARRLDKFLAKHAEELNALGKQGGDVRADAFELLDQSNRILGRVRASLGDRSRMGIGTLSDTLANLYEETRQTLKNPAIVGNRVADISGRAKGRWTDVFDVNSGYKRALLREDAGGARTASGFDTVDRYDPARVSALLKKADSPEGQLDLELVGRGLDSNAKLLEHFADDLKPGSGTAAKIARYRELSREMADDVVNYRSRVALAKEYAAAAAPALKELRNLDAQILAAQARGAKAKSDAIQGSIAEGAGALVGTAFGGLAGGFAGQQAGKLLSTLGAPIIRQVAKSALFGMLKNQQKATQFAAVQAIGRRVTAAGKAVVDRLHSASPYRAVSRTVAMRAPRDTQEEYERTRAWVDQNSEYDMRAKYLASIAPDQTTPTQLRPDLDKTPTVHPLAQRKFLRAARAAMDPAGALEDLGKGAQSKEAADTLRILYPRLHDQALRSIIDGASSMTRKPSMRGQQEISLFFGTPVHFTMEPRFVQYTQGVYQQAQAAGTANQDMLQSSQPSERARQINSKAAQLQATGMQRLESDIK